MTRTSTIAALTTLLCAPLVASGFTSAQTPAAAGAVKQKPRPPIGAVTQMPKPPTVLRPEPQQPAPQPTPPASAGNHVAILPDGTIEERFADGRIRRSRPGVCGWTIVFPDGRTQPIVCQTAVQKLDLPVPTAETAQWLDQHAERLLDIARGLLGSNADTVSNHVAANETPGMTVYERILARTQLVSGLTQAVAGR